MRIKRLDICGFKSFMDRSVFSFDDGVTGVVGPNGCGKSNVVDAIRWVMGEQSAKNLRGRGMEDVIFNGSESKAPLSMAEVTLTFHVDEQDRPNLAPQYAGFPEISVTRRLFRNGDSEYLINKATSRLLDITELFLGTGVGTRAYSIIEQGRVGLIVSAKPEDRRSLIEEAAGVTKYKSRRRAAERKMEYTQQNLLRVADIVAELERRLDSLSRQAKKAEKYKKLKSEMREIELHAASHRFLALMAERKVLEARLNNLSDEEKESLQKVADLEASILDRRAKLEAEGASLQELSDQVAALDRQVQLDEQSLAHWTQDQKETSERLAQASAELEKVTAQQAALETQILSREEELRGLSGTWKEDEVAMASATDELHRVTRLQSELTLRLDSERSALIQIVSRLANLESNLTNLGRQKAELEARKARNRAEAELLRREEAQLDTARADVARQVAERRQLAIEIAERRGQEEETLQRTRQAFAENEIQVIALREELGDKRSRLTSLEEIARNYEGFDRGVRAVMLKVGSGAREAGIFGLVADVLSTSPRFEKAVEAALGERLQHVIVENRGVAVELVEYLKALSEGRSTFVPVPVDAVVPAVRPEPGRPGVVALALDEIRCEDALRPLVAALLGNVVIVEDLAAAQAFGADEARALTLVTLEGEVLRPDGSLTGGVLEGPAVGALQKKREIQELQQEVKRVEERYNEILTRHYTLQKQIGHTEGVLKGLAKNQHAEEVNLAAQEKDLHKAGEDLAKLRDRLGALDGEDGQFAGTLQALVVEEETSRGEVAHGQAEREGREERVRQHGAELESLRQKAEALSAELTTLRVKVAAHNERGEAARKDLENLMAQQQDAIARHRRLGESCAEATIKLESLQRQTAEAEGRRADAAGRLGTLTGELESRRAAHGAETAAVKEQDGMLRELRARLDQLTHGLSEISLKERELALELVHLEETVRERHQTELAHELLRYHLLPQLSAESEQKLKELRAQVEKMGEINLTAIDEHAELSKRFDFLSGQKKDLEGSLEQLTEAIKKIDATSRERFKRTFDIVNEKFQAIFPRLFGGGRAGLILTDEGPGVEPGVEIVAQPPGKKLQSVNLLSGGEKALTAVSMIFAIFLIKPTPFCLLDEVDAPLDEGNVGRYNEMVKEMSKQSQFILITHNKRTMEISDTLYGVTMEEPGVSKIVAVKISEAVAANDDAAVA